jgi:hypothetical protein
MSVEAVKSREQIIAETQTRMIPYEELLQKEGELNYFQTNVVRMVLINLKTVLDIDTGNETELYKQVIDRLFELLDVSLPALEEKNTV